MKFGQLAANILIVKFMANLSASCLQVGQTTPHLEPKLSSAGAPPPQLAHIL